ncbi:MAG: hypothetical protein JSS83_01985 [Cyanobacteria bacterium SZAS LIN-3]|nr:hypothetical protein [Cyanobacteria bacterium SZAS LIN-3]
MSSQNERPLTRVLSVVLTLLLVVLPTTPALATSDASKSVDNGNAKAGKEQTEPKLEFTLSQAEDEKEESPRTKIAAGEPLPAERVKELIDKLAPLQQRKVSEFRLPEQSLVKPRLPGTTTLETFPPKVSLIAKPEAAVQSTPLKVVRVSPHGPIDEAAEVAVSFSQPMTALSEAKAVDPGEYLKFSPQPAGQWEWAGSQTLLFHPARSDKRLPRATKYTLSIPKTTKSITGNQLENDQNYSIETPRLHITKSFPPFDVPLSTTPAILVWFNQDIDRETVFSHLKLLNRDGKQFPCHLVLDSDLKKQREYWSQVKDTPTNQWLCVQPDQSLPLNTEYSVIVEKGCPSAEGPELTEGDESSHFFVHGPMLLVKSPEDPIGPENGVASFSFTNPIANKIEQIKALISISPMPADCKYVVSGRTITIEGNYRPYAKYTVTFRSAIEDIFGQKLGHPATRTFETHAKQTQLRNDQYFQTIAPGQKPVVTLFAQATKAVTIRIFQVRPEQWPAYRETNWNDADAEPIGTLVSTKDYPVGVDSAYLETDLKPFLKSDFGHFIVLAECWDDKHKDRHVSACWTQVTEIGLEAFTGHQLIVLATRLKDGRPIPNARVQLLPQKLSASTDAHGQAQITSPELNRFNHQTALCVSYGPDSALLPEHGNWGAVKAAPTILWSCVSDRTLYRPGQTICVKGWQRGFRFTDKGAIRLFDTKLRKISYVGTASDQTELFKGAAKIDAVGGFAFAATIPKKVNLGWITVTIKASGSELDQFTQDSVFQDRVRKEASSQDFETTLQVSIEEFRRPEFEMNVEAPKGNSFVLGENAKLSARGSYFGGGPLPHANVTWRVTGQPTRYSPPGWPGYHFGYGWYSFSDRIDRLQGNSNSQSGEKTITGLSNSNGRNSINLLVRNLASPRPVRMSCQATILDVNRQEWSNRVALTIHPSKTYVGINTFASLTSGTPVKASIVATDIEGKIRPDRRITVKLTQIPTYGAPIEIESKEFVSTTEPTQISFPAPNGHVVELTATVIDSDGRINQTKLPIIIQQREIAQHETTQTQPNLPGGLRLKCDKAKYNPGDIAEITVTPSSYPAHGIAVISRQTIASTTALELVDSPYVIKIPITEDDYPQFGVEVSLSSANNQFELGEIVLFVPPKSKQLALTLKPGKAEIEPGSETYIDVDLKDNNNNPVQSGHVAIAVVDEALLALRNHHWGDPINVFYNGGRHTASAGSSRTSILLPTSNFEKKTGTKKAKGANFRPSPWTPSVLQSEPTVVDERYYSSGRLERHQLNSVDRYTFYSGSPERNGLSVQVANSRIMNGISNDLVQDTALRLGKFNERINFSELALFAPDVVTDANGHARVPMHLPDNITKYRIMAVAVAGLDKFGAAESGLSTKLDLAIKPSLPRFLNFGDRCELAFVVQNQTDKPVTADVVIRVRNATVAGGSQDAQTAGKRISIGAKDRTEVRFPIATKDAGNIDVQCAVTANGVSDAASMTIPLYMPATMETFATYGQVDKGAVLQKVHCPANVFKQVGGLSVSTSSTALQSLTDAYLYLEHYPFECTEQLSAKLLAMLALHDTLVAFHCLPTEKDAAYRAHIKYLIETLASRQNENGSFGLWKKTQEIEFPFVSLQASQAMFLARQKDFAVGEEVLARCKFYLKNIDRYIPDKYSADERNALQAKALNVQYYEHEIDPGRARQVLAEIGTPSLECASWLLPVLSKDKASVDEVARLRTLINNQIKETASTASTISEGYGESNYRMFYSPRRTDALVMLALIEDQPDSELIAKLAKGLLAHKKNGAWNGTQENSSVLLALDKYFSVYEKETPNFKVQEWLGNSFLGQQEFAGRSTESKQINVPIDYLLRSKSDDVLINKTGPGRLYYRLGLDYASTNLNIKPLSLGFAVKRTYEAVDNTDDVRKDSDGIWHIKAGSTVRCKLNFSNVGTRYHVAMMAPVPGGCEIVNTALAGNRKSAGAPGSGAEAQYSRWITDYFGSWPWLWSWYEHQNLRDHQAEAFASYLGPGDHDYSYTMRATSIGRFVVPPTKIEEMYAPETFGRSASETVVIE